MCCKNISSITSSTYQYIKQCCLCRQFNVIYCLLNATEDDATTVMYVWQMAVSLMKAELKSALKEVGVQCVMICLIQKMLLWCAINLAFQEVVRV